MTLTAVRPQLVHRAFDELEISHIPGGGVYSVDASEGEAERWPFLAIYARRGPAQVRGCVSFDLSDGDFAVVGNRAPIQIRALDGAGILAIRVPAAALGPQSSGMRQSEGVVWSTVGGTASIVAHLLGGLADQPYDYAPTSPGKLAQHVVGLMALVCSDASQPRDRHGRVQLLQVAKDFIESNLSDLELGPEMIAAHTNVSTRTLHRMFESDGTTVRGWIRARRLEHCRVELADLASAHASVSAVGSRWGLWDAAHFSRLFKNEFGVSPRVYRARNAERRGAAHDARTPPRAVQYA